MWKIELDVQQSSKFKAEHFEHMWTKTSEDNMLNLKDSYRFMKDLMTTPLQATTKISENMQSSIAQASRNSLEVSANPMDVGT
jgi:hypothetical protein